MIRSIIILFLAFLSSSHICYSQIAPLAEVSRGIYTDGSKIAKLHKFEEHFSADAEQLRLFRKFNNTRLTLKLINYSYIAMLGATAYAVHKVAQERNDSSVPITVIYAVMGVIGTGQVIGLNNAILLPIKNRCKDRLLRYDPSSTSNKYKEERSRLAISFGNAGIGLAINF